MQRGHPVAGRQIGVGGVMWPSESLPLDFFKMAARAEVVGAKGLGPVVDQTAQALGQLRIHLAGHSLGARLAAWSLKDLSSRVKSLFLVQGAFSSLAFAYNIPITGPSTFLYTHLVGDLRGKLAGAQDKVDGRIVATHSRDDLQMVGYGAGAATVGLGPGESVLEATPMGLTGALRVDETNFPAREEGYRYDVGTKRFINVDFSGKISDHDAYKRRDVAWVHMMAAGMT